MLVLMTCTVLFAIYSKWLSSLPLKEERRRERGCLHGIVVQTGICLCRFNVVDGVIYKYTIHIYIQKEQWCKIYL